MAPTFVVGDVVRCVTPDDGFFRILRARATYTVTGTFISRGFPDRGEEQFLQLDGMHGDALGEPLGWNASRFELAAVLPAGWDV